MSLAHWEHAVVTCCISMLMKTSPEGRAEAAALLAPVLAPEIPADLVPIHGSFNGEA
jgi:hypothetical protein